MVALTPAISGSYHHLGLCFRLGLINSSDRTNAGHRHKHQHLIVARTPGETAARSSTMARHATGVAARGGR